MVGSRSTPRALDDHETAVVGLELHDIIQLKGTSGFTGCIDVALGRRAGRIFFREGQLVHAETDRAVGEPALQDILTWHGGKVALHADVLAPRTTIQRSWQFLLIEWQRLADERRRDGGPSVAAAPGRSRRGGGRARLVLGLVAVVVALAAAGLGAWRFLSGREVSPAPAATPAAAVAAPQAAPELAPLLRLAGGDALGAELGPALARAWLGALGASDLRTVRPRADEVQVQGTLEGRPVAVTVALRSAGAVFDDLLSGSADLVLASRRILPEERRRLAGLGVMTSEASEHVLALDGIAVIVNRANGVAQLDRVRLAELLAGEVSDWSALGLAGDDEWSSVGVNGKGGPVASGVHVYLPDDGSGLAEVIRGLVLGGKPFGPDVKRVASFQAVADAVTADPGGVGLVPMSFAGGARTVPVGEPGAPATLPTPFTVATEEYPLAHRLYLYGGQAARNPQAVRFLEFALGEDGQRAVQRAGLVELEVKAERRSAPSAAPGAYLRYTAGARRLTSTFRFEVGSSGLDNRARRDLERVVAYLHAHDVDPADVRVLGFTDGQGSPAANQKLSADRAQLLAQALAQRGFAGVTVAGMGAALPVADDATEEGRQRNRRVEVWVAGPSARE